MLEFSKHVIRYAVSRDQDHSIMLELFSDFWVINKTPMPLMIGNGQDRTQRMVQADPHPIRYDLTTETPSHEEYIPMMFSTIGSLLLKGSKKELLISSEQFGKCKPFVADIADFDGMVELKTKNGVSQTFAVSISFAPGDFKYTKIVTIAPMFLLVNNTSVLFYVGPLLGVHRRSSKTTRSSRRFCCLPTNPPFSTGPISPPPTPSKSNTPVSIRCGRTVCSWLWASSSLTSTPFREWTESPIRKPCCESSARRSTTR